MKHPLILIISIAYISNLYISLLNAADLVIDSRGYYQNDEIIMQDGNKLVHYQSKGNWSDNFNNYGKFKCKGSLLINKSGKIIYKHMGPLTKKIINDEIKPLLQ